MPKLQASNPWLAMPYAERGKTKFMAWLMLDNYLLRESFSVTY